MKVEEKNIVLNQEQNSRAGQDTKRAWLNIHSSGEYKQGIQMNANVDLCLNSLLFLFCLFAISAISLLHC